MDLNKIFNNWKDGIENDVESINIHLLGILSNLNMGDINIEYIDIVSGKNLSDKIESRFVLLRIKNSKQGEECKKDEMAYHKEQIKKLEEAL